MSTLTKEQVNVLVSMAKKRMEESRRFWYWIRTGEVK